MSLSFKESEAGRGFMVQRLSFVSLREKILDESGKPREKYIGQEGYALFR